jgi:hypothetical protein
MIESNIPYCRDEDSGFVYDKPWAGPRGGLYGIAKALETMATGLLSVARRLLHRGKSDAALYLARTGRVRALAIADRDLENCHRGSVGS